MRRIGCIACLITLLAVVAVSGKLSAQYSVMFSPGVSYQKQLMPEFSFVLGKLIHGTTGMVVGTKNFRLGAESNFKFSSKDFIIAPKAAAEIDFYFVAARAGFVGYIQNGNFDPRLLSEVGITLAGSVSIMYGYAAPLSSSRINDIGKHRVTLSIKLGGGVWSEYSKSAGVGRTYRYMSDDDDDD